MIFSIYFKFITFRTKQLFKLLPRITLHRGKPLALWTLTESSILFAQRLERYVIIARNGDLSCPIKLEASEEQRPVVFSPSSARESQSIAVTLTRLETLQYAITITDRPYPQMTLCNFCPATIDVTNDAECEEPIRFANDWDWSYKLMPNNISYLSFPQSRTIGADNDDGAMTVLYFVAAAAVSEKSSTSCTI